MDTSLLKLDELYLNDLNVDPKDIEYITDSAETRSHAVAIIGMDGRVGAAENLNEFWELLVHGREGIRTLPEERIQDIEAYLAAQGIKLPIPEHLYVRSTFLTDIAQFDPAFFELSRQEANYMEPNQRIFLETAWKALEDSGYSGQDIRGTGTGIYVGISSDFGEDYRHIISSVVPDAPEVAVTGNVKSIIASRLAYHLDLRGPAVVVDTACSSGLMAMYMACRAIRNGECSMAIVGAVNTDLIPIMDDGTNGVGVKDVQDIYSQSGHTRTFDNACDGTVAAEGSFAFVLKSLEEAVRDRDTIRAVILGGAANQDGASMGITAPNSEAQEELIVRALNDAGVLGEKLSYIEAHGTGTRLGDPIEISGIERALAHTTQKKQFCAVGSLKSNIGHLNHASGLGGVAKVVLAMEHRTLPASLNFSIPNRNINFVHSPVYVNDRTVPWSVDPEEALHAGVSSFGLSGTNCHLVIRSAPPISGRSQEKETRDLLLTLSAKSVQALRHLAAAYQKRLSDEKVDLGDAVFTASRGRFHYNFRLAVRFVTREKLCSALGRFATFGTDALPDDSLYYGEHRLIEKESNRRHPSDLMAKERIALESEALSLGGHSLEPVSCEVLDRWAQLYVAGADLPWEGLTRGLDVGRIPLPTNPFQHSRCWVEPPLASTTVEAESDHLLSLSQVSTIDHTLYRKSFRPEERWELSEHKVGGINVLPGTAFVEMIVEHVRRFIGDHVTLSLKDVLFLRPFTVADGSSKELHFLIEKDERQEHFRFASPSHDGGWIVHAEAYRSEDTSITESSKVDLSDLRKQVNIPVPMDPNDDLSRGLELGERWNGSMISGWMDEKNEAFIFELELPDKYRKETKRYNLHPALMDIAVNAANHLMDERELFLPLSYGQLNVYNRLPDHIFVHLKRIGGANGAPVHRFNIALYDKYGNVLIEIRDYCIKSTSEVWARTLSLETDPFKPDSYGLRQQFRPYQLPIKQDLPSGAVLVAGKKSSTVNQIVQTLRKLGREVNEVFPEDDQWERPLELLANEELALAVFTWAPPERLAKDQSGWEIESGEAVLQGFKFLKAWAKAKCKARAGLAVLTQNGCVVEGGEHEIHPDQAALGGLWRVGALEFETLNIRCIEHDKNTPAVALISELADVSRPTFLAYRHGQGYEPVLENYPLPAQKVERINLEEGVFIISGGTGDLGQEVADFLARKGVRHMVLLGQRTVPHRESWAQQVDSPIDAELKERLQHWIELDHKLETFDVKSVNINDDQEVSTAISQIRATYGRIRGVLHLAGKAGDGFLLQKEEQTFNDVYSSKARGALNMHLSTLEDQPDIFILFSSISSLLLSPGQTDYTAANMFLDGLAEWRRHMGLPAVSIQWPAWSETGMAYRYGAVSEDDPFEPLDTSKALALLERILGQQNDLPPVLMPGRKRALMPVQNKVSIGRKPKNVTLLGVLHPNEIESEVANIWASTLLIEEIDIDEEFDSLGGNSILATQMLREYEKSYPGVMDVADLFTYTTIREQASYIRSTLEKDTESNSNHILKTDIGDFTDLDSILDSVSRGEMSVEESVARISVNREGRSS